MRCDPCDSISRMLRNFRIEADRFSSSSWFPSSIRRRPLYSSRHQRWPPIKDDGGENILGVVKIDLRLEENGASHRTDKFELMNRSLEKNPHLVIRRGRDFFIDITFNRPFVKDSDGVSFLFTVAEGKTSLSHGTLVVVPLTNKRRSYENSDVWLAYIDQVQEKKVTVQIWSPAKCPVGKWKLTVDTKLKASPSARSYNYPNPIYILFNPWSPNDEVFLEGEDARTEYVLEDSGLIWRGSHNRLRPAPWAYSQFEENVLDCSLMVLSKHLSPSARANCVKTARALSAVVNSPDDNGVIEGNWSEDFSQGTSPSKWTGSSKILQEYYEKKKPVKYGQCWVFAGVLTTICRAIGIPCRPITNFSSAHDTQSSLTIDYFVDEEGKPVDFLNTDSIWNFHVWCEVWMKRLDMGEDKDYWGWQAIDATPQEQSDGIYRLGPASVEACRRGEIDRPHDVDFLYSEVNADKVYWRYFGPTQPLKLLSKKPDRHAVGLNISTKAIGRFEREDVTLNYKYTENTAKERDAMLRALKLSESSYSRYYLNEEFSDVRFDFSLLDDIVIGSPFRVSLLIENISRTTAYDVKGFLRVDAMLYTGKIKDQVTKKNFQVNIAPESQEEVLLEVTYNDYAQLMTAEGAFNVACLAKVDQTEFEYFSQDDFRVRKPDIKFKLPKDSEIFVGESFKGKVMVKNPLPVTLRKCSFLIDAPGFGVPLKIRLKESVNVGEAATAEFELTPRLGGEKTITAKFNSKELQDVDGFVILTVNPSENDIRL